MYNTLEEFLWYRFHSCPLGDRFGYPPLLLVTKSFQCTNRDIFFCADTSSLEYGIYIVIYLISLVCFSVREPVTSPVHYNSDAFSENHRRYDVSIVARARASFLTSILIASVSKVTSAVYTLLSCVYHPTTASVMNDAPLSSFGVTRLRREVTREKGAPRRTLSMVNALRREHIRR